MKLGRHELYPGQFLKVCTLTACFAVLVLLAAVAEAVAELLQRFAAWVWRAAETIGD
jgi:hypothetical protein